MAESLRLQGEGRYITVSLEELLKPTGPDEINVEEIVERIASGLEEEQ